MLESPAYRVLSLSGHRILARVEIEMAHHGGFDNGKLPVTFENFEQYGMDRHAVAPAIRECCALGFLEVTEVGRAGNAEFRQPSTYRLTYRPVDRANPTNEWQRIHTLEEAEQIAWAARRSVTGASRKRKSSGGKNQVSVGETHTETPKAPMGETPITVLVGGTLTTLDISGEQAQPARSFLSASPASPRSPKLPWTTPTVIEVTAYRQRTAARRPAVVPDCGRVTGSRSTEQGARAVRIERGEKLAGEVDDGIPDFLRRTPKEQRHDPRPGHKSD
jgi:hypothetical protein